jgi:histidinol phosphatase-like PHP family hydrolase
LIQEEENLERAGHTIPLDACIDTPHLEEFEGDYITEYSEEVIMRRPVDTLAHPVINYAGNRRWWKRLKMIICMSSPRIWGLSIGFGMSFIPTSMPL